MRAPAAAALVCVVASAALRALGAEAAGTRLRITNACAEAPIWIAHEAAAGPGPDPQNVRIGPLESYDFRTDDGLASTRYWPKMGCDADGNNCGLGGSGGPGQACVGVGDYGRCAPPIDTKFEASFGHSGQPCDPARNSMQGCDYVDVSLVDGWTLPFRLELNGACEGKGGVAPGAVDCSGLAYGQCPAAELLTTLGTSVSLRAVNPDTGVMAGCYSPCSKLIDGKWRNGFARGRKAQDPGVAPYCCPTPPESPEACRAGPIQDTAYVRALRRLCPGAYSFSYDDAAGLLRCTADTSYNMVFQCPAVLPSHPSRFVGFLPQLSRKQWYLALLGLLALVAAVVLYLQRRALFGAGAVLPPIHRGSGAPLAYSHQAPPPGGSLLATAPGACDASALPMLPFRTVAPGFGPYRG